MNMMLTAKPVPLDIELEYHEKLINTIGKGIHKTKKKLHETELILNIRPPDHEISNLIEWTEKKNQIFNNKDPLIFPTLYGIKKEHDEKKLIISLTTGKQKLESDEKWNRRMNKILERQAELLSKKVLSDNARFGKKKQGSDIKTIENYYGANIAYEYNSRTLVAKDGTYMPLDVSQASGLPAWMGPQYYKESGGKPNFPKPDSHYKLPFKQSARTAEMIERLERRRLLKVEQRNRINDYKLQLEHTGSIATSRSGTYRTNSNSLLASREEIYDFDHLPANSIGNNNNKSKSSNTSHTHSVNDHNNRVKRFLLSDDDNDSYSLVSNHNKYTSHHNNNISNPNKKNNLHLMDNNITINNLIDKNNINIGVSEEDDEEDEDGLLVAADNTSVSNNNNLWPHQSNIESSLYSQVTSENHYHSSISDAVNGNSRNDKREGGNKAPTTTATDMRLPHKQKKKTSHTLKQQPVLGYGADNFAAKLMKTIDDLESDKFFTVKDYSMNVFAKHPLVSHTSSVAGSYESPLKEAPKNPALGIYQHVKYLPPVRVSENNCDLIEGRNHRTESNMSEQCQDSSNLTHNFDVFTSDIFVVKPPEYVAKKDRAAIQNFTQDVLRSPNNSNNSNNKAVVPLRKSSSAIINNLSTANNTTGNNNYTNAIDIMPHTKSPMLDPDVNTNVALDKWFRDNDIIMAHKVKRCSVRKSFLNKSTPLPSITLSLNGLLLSDNPYQLTDEFLKDVCDKTANEIGI